MNKKLSLLCLMFIQGMNAFGTDNCSNAPFSVDHFVVNQSKLQPLSFLEKNKNIPFAQVAIFDTGFSKDHKPIKGNLDYGKKVYFNDKKKHDQNHSLLMDESILVNEKNPKMEKLEKALKEFYYSHSNDYETMIDKVYENLREDQKKKNSKKISALTNEDWWLNQQVGTMWFEFLKKGNFTGLSIISNKIQTLNEWQGTEDVLLDMFVEHLNKFNECKDFNLIEKTSVVSSRKIDLLIKVFKVFFEQDSYKKMVDFFADYFCEQSELQKKFLREWFEEEWGIREGLSRLFAFFREQKNLNDNDEAFDLFVNELFEKNPIQEFDLKKVYNLKKNEQSSHGTHVTGIFLKTFGNDFSALNENYKPVVPVKISSNNKSTNNFIQSLNEIAKNPDVVCINLSWGFGGEYNQVPLEEKPALKEALENCIKHNKLIVIAAGNEEQVLSETLYGKSLYNFAKDNPYSVIIVGACDETGVLESYNNQCSEGFETFYITALGDIESFVPESVNLNGKMKKKGTSMAAPVIAGIVTRLKNEFPFLSMQDIAKAVLEGAEKKTVAFGAGIANIHGAVLKIKESLSRFIDAEKQFENEKKFRSIKKTWSYVSQDEEAFGHFVDILWEEDIDFETEFFKCAQEYSSLNVLEEDLSSRMAIITEDMPSRRIKKVWSFIQDKVFSTEVKRASIETKLSSYSRSLDLEKILTKYKPSTYEKEFEIIKKEQEDLLSLHRKFTKKLFDQYSYSLKEDNHAIMGFLSENHGEQFEEHLLKCTNRYDNLEVFEEALGHVSFFGTLCLENLKKTERLLKDKNFQKKAKPAHYAHKISIQEKMLKLKDVLVKCNPELYEETFSRIENDIQYDRELYLLCAQKN